MLETVSIASKYHSFQNFTGFCYKLRCGIKLCAKGKIKYYVFNLMLVLNIMGKCEGMHDNNNTNVMDSIDNNISG